MEESHLEALACGGRWCQAFKARNCCSTSSILIITAIIERVLLAAKGCPRGYLLLGSCCRTLSGAGQATGHFDGFWSCWNGRWPGRVQGQKVLHRIRGGCRGSCWSSCWLSRRRGNSWRQNFNTCTGISGCFLVRQSRAKARRSL